VNKTKEAKHRSEKEMATQRGGRQVERLVVAEFNIDRGSSITHQYPSPVGVPEQYLPLYLIIK
jgi:hypothetical protein